MCPTRTCPQTCAGHSALRGPTGTAHGRQGQCADMGYAACNETPVWCRRASAGRRTTSTAQQGHPASAQWSSAAAAAQTGLCAPPRNREGPSCPRPLVNANAKGHCCRSRSAVRIKNTPPAPRPPQRLPARAGAHPPSQAARRQWLRRSPAH